MAIVNRDMDATEQRDVYCESLTSVPTGTTLSLFTLPYPCSLQSVRSTALGVSNAMQVAFLKLVYVSGSGSTFIPIGISNLVLVNHASIGSQGSSYLAAQGSTLLNFQAGDALAVLSSVANGNALSLNIQAVFKKTQDIVSMNGV